MGLQVTIDVATIGEALALPRQVAECVDIIELGTPLITNEGVAAIRAVEASYADLTTVMGAADARPGLATRRPGRPFRATRWRPAHAPPAARIAVNRRIR